MRGLIRIGVVVAAAAIALLPVVAGQARQPVDSTWSLSAGGPITQYDYGTVNIGQTVSQTFTLTNSGGSATSSLKVTISAATAFTKAADGCTGTSLGPTKACAVIVQYTPGTPGASDTATLTASGMKPGSSTSLALAGVGAAEGHIYWGNLGPQSISRANLDGTGVNLRFITAVGAPYGLAVDANYIYWADRPNLPGTIGRANLDGTGANQNFITAPCTVSSCLLPDGMAVDANHIYWGNSAPCCSIARANLDGTGVNLGLIPAASSSGIRSVAVDASHLYWTTYGDTIGRANLDGSNAGQNFITGATGIQGVAVDGNFIYWANYYSGTIGRANRDGTGVNQSFITGGNYPTGVAVDANHIYWANYDGHSIGRANLDGTGVNQSFIADSFYPITLAVAAG
jgi:sugar lactone lactonase YvrE